jgi:magnesium and cobalt transporter
LLREANEALGSRFESRGFDTLGGPVTGEFGRVPEAGDEVSLGGYTLRVEQVDGPRAARITARYSGP